jgi:FKBP-type peptidyl-prolyl cis-trans isomerase SlyD
MADLVVADGKIVTLHYVLTDEEGEEIDRGGAEDPLLYLHGHGNIVPGLEKALAGKKVGEKVKAVVPPAEGYGEATGQVEAAPKDMFPKGMPLEVGVEFVAEGPDGSVMPLFIREVRDTEVLITPDHPLSGVTLHFDVEITEIRDASEEEIEQGHPHGPHGHGHGH